MSETTGVLYQYPDHTPRPLCQQERTTFDIADNSRQLTSTQGRVADQVAVSTSQTQEKILELPYSERYHMPQGSFFSLEEDEFYTNLLEDEQLPNWLTVNLEPSLSDKSPSEAQSLDTVETSVKESSDLSRKTSSSGRKRKSSVQAVSLTAPKRPRTEMDVIEPELPTPSISAESVARRQYLDNLAEIVSDWRKGRQWQRGRKLTSQELRDYVPDTDVRFYRNQFEGIVEGIALWTDDVLRHKIVYEKDLFSGSHSDWQDRLNKAKAIRNRENRRTRTKKLIKS